MTPFGIPVDPEVYWKKASVFLSTTGFCHCSAKLSAMLSVAIRGTNCNSGAWANNSSTVERREEVVSAREGCTSLAMACNWEGFRLVRVRGG